MRSYGGVAGDVIKTEKKTGKVLGVKSSPEKGRKRLLMVEKKAGRKTFTVDIPYKEAKSTERKKTYNVDVYEKRRESEYGGMESRFTAGKIKSYLCDESPELYSGRSGSQFRSFGEKDNKISGRLKF